MSNTNPTPTPATSGAPAATTAPSAAAPSPQVATPVTDAERVRRWRLVLGGGPADGIKAPLDGRSARMDTALAALYEKPPEEGRRRAGLGGSAPNVARWLGDIREFFPTNVVRVMQKDAMDRLGLRRLLTEPEMLETVEPDISLVADLISLSGALPARSKEAARAVVRKCTDEVMRRLAEPMRQAVTGALNRSIRNRRPRHREIDWNRTIRANLKHYQADHKTVVPEQRIGYGRKRSSLKDIVLCIDQSGSMATSVVYAGIFGAVLASLPAVSTRVVVFDTEVVDLSDKMADPVEMLFGVQLGGGTDIGRALSYCQSLITRPTDTIFVLISDLIEGGVREKLMSRAASIISSGVSMVTLLALSDEGAPMFDETNAQDLATLGSPAFACTPELFPDLIAAAIQKRDIGQWAAGHGIKTSRAADAAK